METLSEYGREVKRRCSTVRQVVADCRKYLPMIVLIGMGVAMLALWCRKRKPEKYERTRPLSMMTNEVGPGRMTFVVIIDANDPTLLSDVVRLCVRLWTKAKRPRDVRLVVRFNFDDSDDDNEFWDPLERRIGSNATFDWRRRTRVTHGRVRCQVGKRERVLWLGTPLWRPVRDWDVRLASENDVVTQHHSGEAGDRNDRQIVVRKFVDWSEEGPYPLRKTKTSVFPISRQSPVRAWSATSEWCLMSGEIWSAVQKFKGKNLDEIDWILTLIVRMRTDRLFCGSPHGTGFVPIASCSSSSSGKNETIAKFDWFGFIGALREPSGKKSLSSSSSSSSPASERLIRQLASVQRPKTRERLASVLASLGIRWWPDYARAPFARDGLVWPLDPREMRIVLGRTVTL